MRSIAMVFVMVLVPMTYAENVFDKAEQTVTILQTADIVSQKPSFSRAGKRPDLGNKPPPPPVRPEEVKRFDTSLLMIPVDAIELPGKGPIEWKASISPVRQDIEIFAKTAGPNRKLDIPDVPGDLPPGK